MHRTIVAVLTGLGLAAGPLDAQMPVLVPPGTFRGTLLSVAVYDPQVATAVGYDGVILRTQDGGSNWWRIPSGTTAVLDGSTWVGVTVFAVGGSGTILRSLDGGVNWHVVPSGVSVRLKSVHFGDAQHGIIVGEGGVALTTQDGGSSWSVAGTGISSNLIDVRMSGLSAIAVGTNGVVLRTVDGGRTWMRVSAPTTDYLTGVTVTNSGMAVIVGLGPSALWSRNLGVDGWMVGPMVSGVGMSDVAHVDGPTLLSVGSSATMMRSIDYGSTWQVTFRGSGFAFEDVGFANPLIGWAVGNSGVIMRTVDGGTTWIHQMAVPGTTVAAAVPAPVAAPAVPLYLQVLGLSVLAPGGPGRWSASVSTASNGNRMDEISGTGAAGEVYSITVVRAEGRECANALAQLIQSGGQMRTAPTYTPPGWFQVSVEKDGTSAFTCLPLRQGSLLAGFAMTSVALIDAATVRPVLTAVADASFQRWGRP